MIGAQTKALADAAKHGQAEQPAPPDGPYEFRQSAGQTVIHGPRGRYFGLPVMPEVLNALNDAYQHGYAARRDEQPATEQQPDPPPNPCVADWIVDAFVNKTPLRTRGGQEVRVVCIDAPAPKWPVICAGWDHNNNALIYRADGRYNEGDRDHTDDLLPPAPPEPEREPLRLWAAVFTNKAGNAEVACARTCIESAESAVAAIRPEFRPRVVEFVEKRGGE